ncbi:MAG: DUF3280 domain-containing protein [Geminicoccaceae bacterium]|nr:DUF3280 domain-containing protein [Geminicoccaceae bacterium]
MRLLFAAVLLSLPGVFAGAAEPPKVAVFEMALVDSSLEGEMTGADAAEAARLDLLDLELRSRLEASERLQVLVPGETTDLGCRACELDAAEALDADFALSAWVQKVSDLILNINLKVTAVDSGRVVFQDSVDIRGNTDDSWLRGLRYLVDRRLLAPPG